MSSPYDYAYSIGANQLAVSAAIWAGANVMNQASLVVLNFRMSADAENSLQPA